MSDPVSNADIEDVLSSIRRLVSEDPVGANARRPAEPEAEVERFVLTPALRVVEAEEASDSAPQETVEDFVAEDDGTDAPAEAAQPSQVSTAFEAATEWHEEPSDRAEDEDHRAEESEEHRASPEETTLEARIAELEAAIEQAPQEWEPDGSEDGTSDETRPLSFDTGAETALMSDVPLAEDDAAETDTVATQPEAPADTIAFFSEPEDEAPSDAPAEETTVWQDVEAEAGFATDEPDPLNDDQQDAAEALHIWQDTPLQGDPQDTAPEIEAEAEDITQDTAAASPTEDDDGFGNLMADDATTIDEEALREIVSDLVREELQGVLGERITRNVRRLVRREIQRAMAMRDLE